MRVALPWYHARHAAVLRRKSRRPPAVLRWCCGERRPSGGLGAFSFPVPNWESVNGGPGNSETNLHPSFFQGRNADSMKGGGWRDGLCAPVGVLELLNRS